MVTECEGELSVQQWLSAVSHADVVIVKLRICLTDTHCLYGSKPTTPGNNTEQRTKRKGTCRSKHHKERYEH